MVFSNFPRSPLRFVEQAILALSLMLGSPAAIHAGSRAGQNTPGKVYNIQEFDRACGQPGHNCQRAFQFAFKTMAQSGGGTLQLPAGTFPIYLSGVAENVPGGVTLPPQSLIVVSPNTTIEGHLGADGKPDSVIEWRNTSVPTLIFAKANHSGMRNLHVRFTGGTAHFYPFGDIALLKAIGYHPEFPHGNQMSGGNFDIFTFAFVFDSEGCTFDHLLFDSATHDNAHIYNMAINMKGKGVIETNGGGVKELANSNRVTNIEVYDYSNAFLICGQNNFLMENIKGDRRGSIPDIAPGHMLYTSATLQFDMAAHIVRTLLSTNTTVQNLTEGPNTYSNVRSGGTLAIKFLNGAHISNVVSQHPEGLIQTIYSDQDVTFSDLNWTSNYPLCTNVPTNCSTPAIYSAASPPEFPVIKNLTFQNITVVSTASPTTVVLMGDNLRVDGMQITTPADFVPGQKATSSVLSVKNTNGAVIKGYVFTPVMDKYDPSHKYNSPFTGWNPSKNVAAEVTVRWPRDMPVPEKTSILSSGYQDRTPESNNTIRNSVVKR